MGLNKGFAKEQEIIRVLNNRTVNEFDSNYKTEISKIFPNFINTNDKVTCFKNEGVGLEKKNDLTITIKNKNINISVKIGTNNSLHQESINSFIEFLNSKIKLSKTESDLILEFHWCDGTLNNTGPISNRKHKREYKRDKSNKYTTYINVLRKYKYDLFNRVMLGTINQPDYLLYFKCFDDKIPKFIPMSDLLKFHLGREISEDNVGIFRLQNCNACLKGQDHGHKYHICVQGCPKIEPKTKKHRNDIQFKMIDIQSNFL